MKTLALILSVLAAARLASAAPLDTRLFEMRIYHAAPGKLADLEKRFRDHTVKLFAKHGMENLGYWIPLDEKDGSTNTLIYVLAYPNRDAREKSWQAFMADPDWQAAYKASEVNGKLVEKAEVKFLVATDYSPVITPRAAPERVFELRTYTAAEGRLANLNARFRDHTCALFEKHGIRNVAYWTLAPTEKDADKMLIYIVSHTTREAAAASFRAFGADPAWQAARRASEERAGGPLTVKDGVKSVFLKATDYSPMK